MSGKTYNLLAGTDNKVEAIVQHCVYMMATGKWPTGYRLPSIRTAEQDWGVNRLTIQRAYQRLADRGLVEIRDRSGYYVADHTAARRLTRHRYSLERLHDRFGDIIREETGFSPLAVFRYLARLSEIREAEQPECAFIECTAIQSRGHAQEIQDRLGIPVLPLTTDELEGDASRLPQSLRVVFTTLFHGEEVERMVGDSGPDVSIVPIEVSPRLIESVDSDSDRAILVEAEETMARHIVLDAQQLLHEMPFEVEVVSDVIRRVEAHLNRRKKGLHNRTILLSPRHWGRLPEHLRRERFIRPITFSIVSDSWSSIADVLGMPLGEVPAR